jgi:Rhs element Vgr protein
MTERDSVAITEGNEGITFALLINGKESTASADVVRIIVRKGFNQLSSAEIVLLDGDVSEGSFDVSNSKDFLIGNEIEVHAGYDGKKEIIFKGIIIKQAIKSGENGSALTVTARNLAYSMALQRDSLVSSDKTDSDVMRQLIQKHGLKANVEDTSVQYETLTQFNCSDWDFLNMRAEANAMLVYTADDEIIVQKPKPAADAKLEISYGSLVYDFEMEMDGRTSFPDYKASAWNFTHQEPDLVEQKTGLGETKQGNVSAADLASALGNKTCKLAVPSSLNNPDVLSGWLDTRILHDNLSRITGHVTVQGFADIHPGDCINLQRVGDRFNGPTLVSGVEHRIEDNWHTTIRFGLEAEVYARKYDDINDLKASGMLPAVNGLQTGKVVQIEEDPLGEDRVLVRLPHFPESEDSFWARVAAPDAGKERGVFFRPEIDDEVVVGFIDDHPNHAVILGMLNSSQLPAPIPAEKKNALKGIYTREKIKLEFDDEKKCIYMETPGGNKLSISDEDKAIALEDEHGNKITMNADGITVESAKALNLKASTDVVIEGSNINIKAQAAFKAEGASQAEVSSSGNAVLKGAVVQIN